MADERPQNRHLNQGGNDGNAYGAGRPKNALSITHHMRELLEANDRRKAKQLAAAIVREAIKGNATALKSVLDRIDGPVVQRINVSQLSNEQLIALLAESAEGGSEEEGP